MGGADVSIAPAHELSSDGLHVTDTDVGARRRRSAVRKRKRKRIDDFMATVDFSKRSVVGVGWERGKGEGRLFIGHSGKRRRGRKVLSHGHCPASLESTYEKITMLLDSMLMICMLMVTRNKIDRAA